MTKNAKRYALIWDGIEFEGMEIGTAAEVAFEFLNWRSWDLKVEKDDDGNLAYWLDTAGDDDWEKYDLIEDQGDDDANMDRALEMYFRDYIAPEKFGGYALYELATSEQEAIWTGDIEDLLDQVTLREARDNELDPDDDPMGLRAWVFVNKAGGQEVAA